MQGRRSFAGFSNNRLTPSRKVIRKSTSTKDLRILSEKISLESILGFTTTNRNGLACNPLTGVIAYPAGCVIVLLNIINGSQSHIFNPDRKTITSLIFSSDGKYLASGECGHNPSVRVWEIGEPSTQTSELQGHKYGINCVEFSPNMRYLVSVGDQHDMLVNIWNWRSGDKIACNKIGWKVRALSFSSAGNFFVTVGNRHIKFWYFDSEVLTTSKATKPISGRSAILGDNKNGYFCDVACSTSKDIADTFSITKGGLLCAFSEKRVLYKSADLNASSASCLAVNSRHIFCGCSDGLIRVYSAKTLEYITTLPQPHWLGVDVAKGTDLSHLTDRNDQSHCPDVVSMVIDNNLNKLTCTYNDHSMYCWDVKDIFNVKKTSSYLYHSACIWGIEAYPFTTSDSSPSLPGGSFLTCSSDDTVRIWNLEDEIEAYRSFPRNIYSKELLKVTYTNKDLTNLQDVSLATGSASSDSKSGIRCIKVSPDGQLLAVGDRSGNLRVYDLQDVQSLIRVEAHESEILCVEFSPIESGFKLLATSSRDRLIHIFDINKDFSLIQTIDEHSSSITAVRFNYDRESFQLLSCGSDKSIMFHKAQISDNGTIHFTRNSIVVGKATMYDMDIDPTRKLATTVGQDRNVRVYDIQSAKQTRCYKGTLSEDGTVIKISLDPSGVYAATSCSDKTFSVYDFDSGECVAIMHGHSEIVTGLCFTVDGRRLVSVSGDGCIFIWKLPLPFRQSIAMKMRHIGMPLPKAMAAELDPFSAIKKTTKQRTTSQDEESDINSPENEFGPAMTILLEEEALRQHEPVDHRFSTGIGRLPGWAKKQLTGNVLEGSTSRQSTTPSESTGKWAQTVLTPPMLAASDNVSETTVTDETMIEVQIDETFTKHDEPIGIDIPSTPLRKSRSSWSKPLKDVRLSKSVPDFRDLMFDTTEVPIPVDSGNYIDTYVANRSSGKRGSFFKKARQEIKNRLSRHGTDLNSSTVRTAGTSPVTNTTAVITPVSSHTKSRYTSTPIDEDNKNNVFNDNKSHSSIRQRTDSLDSKQIHPLPKMTMIGDEQQTPTRDVQFPVHEITFPIQQNGSDQPTQSSLNETVVLQTHTYQREDNKSIMYTKTSLSPNGNTVVSSVSTVSNTTKEISSSTSIPINVNYGLKDLPKDLPNSHLMVGSDGDDISLLEDLSDIERPLSDEDLRDSENEESALKEHFEQLGTPEPLLPRNVTPPQKDSQIVENVENCRTSISAKFLSLAQQCQGRYKPSTLDSTSQRQLKALCNIINDQKAVQDQNKYQAKPVSPPDTLQRDRSRTNSDIPKQSSVDENLLRAAKEIDTLAKNLKEISVVTQDTPTSLRSSDQRHNECRTSTPVRPLARTTATNDPTHSSPGFFPCVTSPSPYATDATRGSNIDNGDPSSRLNHNVRLFQNFDESCTDDPSRLNPPTSRRTRPRYQRPKSLIISVPSLREEIPDIGLERRNSDPELEFSASSNNRDTVIVQDFASNNLQHQSLSFTIPLDDDPVDISRDPVRVTPPIRLKAKKEESRKSPLKKSSDGVLWMYEVGDQTAAASALSLSTIPERETKEEISQRDDISPRPTFSNPAEDETISPSSDDVALQSSSSISQIESDIGDAVNQVQSAMKHLTSLQTQAIENNSLAVKSDLINMLSSTYESLQKEITSGKSKLMKLKTNNYTDEIENNEIDKFVENMTKLETNEIQIQSRNEIVNLLHEYSNLLLKTVEKKNRNETLSVD